jgi:hypothetical protein
MARARNIKPGFATNEDLAECSIAARLCFALLPMIADRAGRLEDRPKRIKGELFRFDSVDVEPLLDELEQHGFIARYTVDGKPLMQILAFDKHQHPHHKEPSSSLPPHPSLGLGADGKWVKPGAVVSSDGGEALGFGGLHEPKALDKPETSPGLDPPRVDLSRGENPVDSGYLIPDTLIPEEKKAPRKRAEPPPSCPDDVEPQVWADWSALRAKKRATVSQTAVEEARKEAAKAGVSLNGFLRIWCRRGSQGLEASWLKADEIRSAQATGETPWQRSQRERHAENSGGLVSRKPPQQAALTTLEAEDARPAAPALG